MVKPHCDLTYPNGWRGRSKAGGVRGGEEGRGRSEGKLCRKLGRCEERLMSLSPVLYLSLFCPWEAVCLFVCLFVLSVSLFVFSCFYICFYFFDLFLVFF